MSVAAWPPTAGTYAMRLVRHGPRVPVRIWHGQPIVDGEILDRSPRWCCEIDGRTTYESGEILDIDDAWPFCAREPIDAGTYVFMVAHAQWARAHASDHPKARPRRPIDFNTLKMRF